MQVPAMLGAGSIAVTVDFMYPAPGAWKSKIIC